MLACKKLCYWTRLCYHPDTEWCAANISYSKCRTYMSIVLHFRSLFVLGSRLSYVVTALIHSVVYFFSFQCNVLDKLLTTINFPKIVRCPLRKENTGKVT